MEKKRVDESVQVPASGRVDRFGFVKQEHNSPDGPSRNKSALEYQR